MKFKRTDLIARVKHVIAERHRAAYDRNVKAAASHEDRRAKYLAETHDAWKQLAENILTALRAGVPMTRDDIPSKLTASRASSYLETWDARTPDLYVADTGPLEQLLVLLEAATDDEVSTSSLERMGFRTAQLFSR